MNNKYVSLIVVLVGLIVMIIPLPSVLKAARIKISGTKTSGTVTALGQSLGRKSELRYITVTFITEEKTRVEATASKRQSVRQGDIITLWYDPADPQKVYLGDSIGYNMRAVIIGLAIFLLFSIFFIKALRTDRESRNLLKTGMKVSAEFISVERSEEYRMGQNNPWHIKCRWTDQNNREYFFSSSNYVVDLSPYITGRNNFEVYINPADPSKYVMDQSFLPKDKTIPPVLKLWS